MTGALVGSAMVAVPAFGLPVSPDDYEFPIGRIDAQIACGSTAARGEEEPACLAEFRGVVIRSGDDLTFRLDDGKTRTIHSNSQACRQIPVGDCVVYRLVGYVAASRQFVLRLSAYESTAATLVSRRTGRITTLEGFPHLSPGGRQFVTVAASDAWTINNPIAIYANTDPPKLVWRFPEPKEYEQYTFDGWQGDDRVNLHTTSNPQIDTDLSRTADGWALRRPSGRLDSGINGK
jgi:hypothetical protein